MTRHCSDTVSRYKTTQHILRLATLNAAREEKDKQATNRKAAAHASPLPSSSPPMYPMCSDRRRSFVLDSDLFFLAAAVWTDAGWKTGLRQVLSVCVFLCVWEANVAPLPKNTQQMKIARSPMRSPPVRHARANTRTHAHTHPLFSSHFHLHRAPVQLYLTRETNDRKSRVPVLGLGRSLLFLLSLQFPSCSAGLS